eukprot:gnl/Trimastix_PCT/3472.p1 GENE.gnl/Trimastix_PCT/3472~~gnl/Trimastix_PCT/3472.p1  ORF type:complete len:488 (+),score=104.98 gnl/Trimastix_PCT/3472:149-1465(+)
MRFLREKRTERERVSYAEQQAIANGFQRLDIGEEPNRLLKAGDKVYYINRHKNILLAIVGEAPMTERSRMVMAHVDTPRLDLKPNPFYENREGGLALAKTHYYGGIKKYQWGTVPLALVGTAIQHDGTPIPVHIGAEENDPVFCIPDLLIHLWGKEQCNRRASEVLKGEELNVLVGASRDSAGASFKDHIIRLVERDTGIQERDLCSAELSFVPAITPRYVGVDRGLIGGPGQDDGVCAFAVLRALFEAPHARAPPCTAATVLMDKEEIGSEGCTSAKSAWLQMVWNDLTIRTGAAPTLTSTHLAMSHMQCLMADVTAGVNPNFDSIHDARNAATLGCGVVLEKWSGSKRGSSDCAPEFVGEVVRCLDAHHVAHQFGGFGKVDEGGGGTMASEIAELFNADVLDCGPALLSMHSCFELSHTGDLYWTLRAFQAFLGCC